MEKEQNLEETRKMMYKVVDEYIDTLKDVDDTIKVQEKVLEVVFRKNVNIKALKHYLETYDNDLALKLYNSTTNNDEQLTKEEFDLVQIYASIYMK